MIIFVKSRASANRVKASVTRFIEDRLKLKVNEAKSGVRRPEEVNFLGHSIQRTGELGLSKPSELKLKAKLKEMTSRSRGISLEQMLSELNPVLIGWLNYFQHAKMKWKLRAIMAWLRRRLRCFRLKQCKRAIGIYRFLSKLGVPSSRSWSTASISKGWYRKSLTPASNEGMNNAWFVKLGLFDMYTYYGSKLMKPPST